MRPQGGGSGGRSTEPSKSCSRVGRRVVLAKELDFMEKKHVILPWISPWKHRTKAFRHGNKPWDLTLDFAIKEK